MTDKHYVFYLIATGRTIRTMFCAENTRDANVDSGVSSFIEYTGSYDFELVYVDVASSPPVLIDRPTQTITQDTDTILADGIEKSTFTGIAEGSELFINEISNGIVGADGIATASFDTVGAYKIKFVLFPYLDAEYTVNAT